MTKLIYAVKGAEVISERFNIPLADLVDVFADIPSVEMDSPKGTWVFDKKRWGYRCSVCGEEPYDDCGTVCSPYCPFCGAEMNNAYRPD